MKIIINEKNDIQWNLLNFLFWKDKMITTKLLCPKQNKIIVTGSAKQHGAQIQTCYNIVTMDIN
jgi:hypothetical protein